MQGKEEKRGGGNEVKCCDSKSVLCFKMFMIDTSKMFIKKSTVVPI